MLVVTSLIDRLILIIFCSFGVYRISQLLVLDDGPFQLFKRFRRYLGIIAAEEPGPGLKWSIAELFRCTFCIGFWLALIPAAMFAHNVAEFIAIWFGVAGIQTYLQYQSLREL